MVTSQAESYEGGTRTDASVHLGRYGILCCNVPELYGVDLTTLQ